MKTPDVWSIATQAEATEAGMLGHWMMAQRVLLMRESIDEGNGFLVMEAMSIICQYRLPVPDWLAADFVKRVQKVTGREVRSWDDAFGSPIPKGGKLPKLKFNEDFHGMIYMACKKAIKSNEKLYKPLARRELFKQVAKEQSAVLSKLLGKKIQISGAKVERIFSRWNALVKRKPQQNAR